ncbi:MAG: ATP-dependent Clp protease adapter ClpS [Acidimicrobiia bacterium]|nr:ATP-dependent Clp protease adapter ClpS [Acidimicrobiia bacterium]
MPPAPRDRQFEDTETLTTATWNLVVWNDPVNLMDYVVYVFRRLFGYSKADATRLMLEVHQQGRSVVASGPRERVEMQCFELHRHGLWATVERT